MIKHVVDGDTEDDKKYAIPLGEDLATGSVGDPSVEVVSQERHEQRKTIDQAIGCGSEASTIQGQDLRQKSVHRVVGEKQACHKDEDLQKFPQLRRPEQAEKWSFFNLACRLGFFELRRFVKVTANVKRQENWDYSGHKCDAPAVMRHRCFAGEEGDQSEHQRGKHVAQRKA
jgi:hypothetical protein